MSLTEIRVVVFLIPGKSFVAKQDKNIQGKIL